MPSIGMLIFTSVYGVVDGFFVSNYVGETPFASLNLVWPFVMLLAAVGFMFGTGGSALVAFLLGQGEKERANATFSLIIYVMIALGLILGALGCVFAEPVSRFLGATDNMVGYSVTYCRIMCAGSVAFALQYAFQCFMITSERPRMAFRVTLASGITNMFLDWLFMGVMGLGVGSAAAASVIGMAVGAVIPLIYYSRDNTSLLRLGRPLKEARPVLKAAGNGASEFVTNISESIVSMLFNYSLIMMVGEKGVAVYGIIMYTSFVFVSVFIGYDIGSGPVIAYHYGTGVTDELKNVCKKSAVITGLAGIAMFAASELLAEALAAIFAGYDPELFEMTTRAIRIYSFAYIFMGFNVFGSSLFTALNNGFISALISLCRVFIFQIAALFILPRFFGLDGIWAAIAAAEVCAIAVTATCVVKFRPRYGYY